MFEFNRRKVLATGATMLLAACQVVPKGVTPPPPAPPEKPSATVLPQDQARHRVALLVPTSGPNAAVGQALANAATMALLDTNASNLRITTYDTATGPAAAATRAIADGNKLILGPLMGDDVAAVANIARPARVPVISFSNDAAVAGRDVFIMGSLPSQSITRTITYARSQGLTRFAALVPEGEYGMRASAAVNTAVTEAGGSLVMSQTYSRTNTSIISAAKRIKTKGGVDAVLIADSGRFALLAAPQLRASGAATPRLLGTELWSGEAGINSPVLRGALFSALSDANFRQFSERYKSRFGAAPYRISTMAYDSVLLTLRLAREWNPGTTLPTGRLVQNDAFSGVDGPFRFSSRGVIERAYEVREVRAGSIAVISAAPSAFAD